MSSKWLRLFLVVALVGALLVPAAIATAEDGRAVLVPECNGILYDAANPDHVLYPDGTFNTEAFALVDARAATAGVVVFEDPNATSADWPTTDRGLVFLGSPHDDIVCGAIDRNDYIRAGAGDDMVFGYGGYPLTPNPYFVSTIAPPFLVNIREMRDVWYGVTSPTVNTGIGDIILGQMGDDDVYLGGSPLDTLVLTANAVGGLVIGGGGGDYIEGSFTAVYMGDFLRGRAGDDTIVGWNGSNMVIGDAQDDELYGGIGGDEIRGGAGDDVIFGGVGPLTPSIDDGNDEIYGGDGNDVIEGEEGMDFIWALAGNDAVGGGQGTDCIYGGTGADMLDGYDATDYLFANDGPSPYDFVPGSTTVRLGCTDALLPPAGSVNEVRAQNRIQMNATPLYGEAIYTGTLDAPSSTFVPGEIYWFVDAFATNNIRRMRVNAGAVADGATVRVVCQNPAVPGTFLTEDYVWRATKNIPGEVAFGATNTDSANNFAAVFTAETGCAITTTRATSGANEDVIFTSNWLGTAGAFTLTELADPAGDLSYTQLQAPADGLDNWQDALAFGFSPFGVPWPASVPALAVNVSHMAVLTSIAGVALVPDGAHANLYAAIDAANTATNRCPAQPVAGVPGGQYNGVCVYSHNTVANPRISGVTANLVTNISTYQADAPGNAGNAVHGDHALVAATDGWLDNFQPVFGTWKFQNGADADPRWVPILKDDGAIDMLNGQAGQDRLVTCNPGIGSFYLDQAHTDYLLGAAPFPNGETTFGFADGTIAGQATEHYLGGVRDVANAGQWAAYVGGWFAQNPGNALNPVLAQRADWFCK